MNERRLYTLGHANTITHAIMNKHVTLEVCCGILQSKPNFMNICLASGYTFEFLGIVNIYFLFSIIKIK